MPGLGLLTSQAQPRMSPRGQKRVWGWGARGLLLITSGNKGGSHRGHSLPPQPPCLLLGSH